MSQLHGGGAQERVLEKIGAVGRALFPRIRGALQPEQEGVRGLLHSQPQGKAGCI